jgi:hypothetical protein
LKTEEKSRKNIDKDVKFMYNVVKYQFWEVNMGKKNSASKYEITVTWKHKLMAILAMLVIDFLLFSAFGSSESIMWTVSLIVYLLLFVYLAVMGSNGKVAAWISERKLFSTVFLMPTLIWAFYGGIMNVMSMGDGDAYLGAFGALLTILSIPYSLLLIRLRGGIRRMNSLISFVVFPIALLLVCILFVKVAIVVAIVAALLVLLFCFVVSLIQHSRDHKADYIAENHEGKYGNYKAVWDGHPQSDVKDNVICLRGTVVVEYYGEFYKDSADEAAQNLINAYVMTVKSDMPGYSVDKASIYIKYEKKD